LDRVVPNDLSNAARVAEEHQKTIALLERTVVDDIGYGHSFYMGCNSTIYATQVSHEQQHSDYFRGWILLEQETGQERHKLTVKEAIIKEGFRATPGRFDFGHRVKERVDMPRVALGGQHPSCHQPQVRGSTICGSPNVMINNCKISRSLQLDPIQKSTIQHEKRWWYSF